MVLACLFLTLASAACGREASLPPAPQVPPPAPVESRASVQSEAVAPSPQTSSTLTFVQIVVGEALIIGHVLPLTDAISDLQTNRVKALLEGGADPNVREEDATSWPPLAFAMRGMAKTYETSEDEYNARREMMELLLTHGADANIRWCDSDRPRCNESIGLTPLMYAATLGYEEFRDILLKYGADPSLRDWRGLTAADYWGVKTTRPASWSSLP